MIRENGSEYGTVYIFLLNLIKTAIKIRFDWKFILISVENVWNLYVKNLLHYGYVDIFFLLIIDIYQVWYLFASTII